MMNEKILLPHIRAVTEEDKKNLPRFSYSRLEQFINCPYAYDLKYNKGLYSSDTSIALELGSLLHKVLETKCKMIMNHDKIDYDLLYKLITDGIIETDQKTKEQILGVDALKQKYWETWFLPDSEGRTYEQKIDVFKEVLYQEMEQDDWEPYDCEMYFEFVWDDKVIFNGFIDRVDVKNGKYRIRDYKTSKKIYDRTKLVTSLQFGIYNLALLSNEQIKQTAKENVYDFVLIGQTQQALTKGWETRLVKKLQTLFENIDSCNQNEEWKPNPSPLCYWCNMSATNPNAHEFKTECEYYSLWTPTEKNFSKNKEWGSVEETPKRKLIF